jgi:NADH-quinone oxidoreductase subunit I
MRAYFHHIYQSVSTIMIGMSITFRQMFNKAVTIQYPEQRLQLPERERNRLFVNMEDCIGCDQCAKACPVSCIDIETVKVVPGDVVGKTGVTSQGKKKALHVTDFTIDFAKCCYCQLCVFPCPTECIYMTDVFEFSTFDRQELLYQFSDLTPSQAEEKKKMYTDYSAEQEKKKALAAQEAAAKKTAEEKAKAENKTDEKPETKSAPDNKETENPKES